MKTNERKDRAKGRSDPSLSYKNSLNEISSPVKFKGGTQKQTLQAFYNFISTSLFTYNIYDMVTQFSSCMIQ